MSAMNMAHKLARQESITSLCNMHNLSIYHSGGNHFHLTPRNEGWGIWLINFAEDLDECEHCELPTQGDDMCMFGYGENYFFTELSQGVKFMNELITKGVGVDED